ncbi:N-acetyl-gamma-glutamyl-phosphate reductase [Nonlabens sp. Hel1_33_55]|uniref:N-acetyl-gamma-glutamyl-phosphate reductase n=1 Tax=Nonlabens sp. Hel1_33_55 TaxID=1336802 RepID=UPI000875EE32|nr:N-acetyl-gamma-glutamyl-phosphate reductase [Nonlabens sp. Hel1_33_55]SCY04013.1 N-acetyl-gamma-glutamyl-phosphate reductase [Nonlabens sp. Hel1_33_55]
MIKAGIIGGSGFTAGELIRILLNHPAVEIDFVFTTSKAGQPVSDIHQDLYGVTDIKFTDQVNLEVDVVFLCLGHGNSSKFLEVNDFSDNTKIIDLSNDFRLTADSLFQGKQFVYGLPELNLDEIEKADYIANPGCFATAIQQAILPLAANESITSDIHVNAVTGATGAGTSLSDTTNFVWRDNNFSHYKAFNHQHLGEINQSTRQLQKDFDQEIHFIPNRGNFSRGIFATVYTQFDGSLEDAQSMYKKFYIHAAFTHVTERPIHMKQVVNTNNCLIQLEKHGTQLLVTSAIDNLLKGASGQAVHNMNLIYGLEETLGLNLKASYF